MVVPAVLLLAAYWALFGGEYSVFEVRSARRAADAEAAQLERIRAEIDSLQAWTDSLEVDPATIERLARERFGMIRDGEILYRIVGPSDSSEAGDEEDPGS